MSTTDQVLEHMLAGYPLTAVQARWRFGVPTADFPRVLWNIRIRGYHVETTVRRGTNKFDGRPVSFVEYRIAR